MGVPVGKPLPPKCEIPRAEIWGGSVRSLPASDRSQRSKAGFMVHANVTYGGESPSGTAGSRSSDDVIRQFSHLMDLPSLTQPISAKSPAPGVSCTEPTPPIPGSVAGVSPPRDSSKCSGATRDSGSCQARRQEDTRKPWAEGPAGLGKPTEGPGMCAGRGVVLGEGCQGQK